MKNILNNKTISLLSFEADGEKDSYQLKDLDESISQKLKATVEKLEGLPQVRLCARGDSFATREQHDEFINQKLAKFFIVGPKANGITTIRQEGQVVFLMMVV